MVSFLSYELRSAIAIAFVWCLFSLFLRREPSHRINRWILLGAVLLSLSIPLFSFTIHRQVVLLPELGSSGVASDVTKSYQGTSVFFGLLSLGMMLMFGVRAFSWLTAARIAGRGSKIRSADGVSCVVVSGRIAPFVWMRTVVLSREDYDLANGVLAHESAHIHLKHYLDLFLLDLLVILQWFNPFAWLIRRDLRRVHEYEADAMVVTGACDKRSYCMLLLERAAGGKRLFDMVQFNGGSVRSRIVMLERGPSPGNPGKCLPMLLGVLLVFACSIHIKKDYVAGYAVMDPVAIVNMVSGRPRVKPDMSFLDALTPPVSFNGEMPEILADTRLQKWFAASVSIPETDATGTVLASFRVAKTGKMEDLAILKGAAEPLNQAVLETLSEMPEWAPATVSGQPRDFVLILPISFQ